MFLLCGTVLRSQGCRIDIDRSFKGCSNMAKAVQEHNMLFFYQKKMSVSSCHLIRRVYIYIYIYMYTTPPTQRGGKKIFWCNFLHNGGQF